MHRDMKMSAPRAVRHRFEREVEVLEELHIAVARQHAGLVQVAWFSELREFCKLLRCARATECRTHLDFSDTHSISRIELERVILFFKHDSAVADVVTDAEISAGLLGVEALIEQRDDMLGAVEQTSRLRLKVERDADSCCIFGFGKFAGNPLELRGGKSHARATTFIGEVRTPSKWDS